MYVQYGCGWSAPEGWQNFDASPTLRFERIPILGRMYMKNDTRFPENVRFGDIVRGLPIADGSVQGLYASHVLEHLSLADFRVALANSFKLLAPGGVFRLIVPDLRERARRYVASSTPDAASHFMVSTHLGHVARPKGLLASIKAMLGNSNHLWMWDEEAMTEELHKAGFTAIRRCAIGDSRDVMFAHVEEAGRFLDGDIPELAMECRKAA